MSSNGNGMERREFLKVLGAAGAGATLAGCATEPERLIPYLVQPEEIVPGTSTWYRTTCRECPAGCGMTIRTREGRAVKAEGNPESPVSHGRLCSRGQASLHGLYDPDRIRQALRRDGEGWSPLSWDRAEQTLAERLLEARGSAVLLSRPGPGSMDRLLDAWCEALGVRRVVFDPFGHEPIRAAYRMLYGRDALPVHDFSRADVVVSFGADFMETWLSPVEYTHDFVEARAYAGGRRGRFISVTPHQSLTDLNADRWLPARPGTEHLVALAMARLVADQTGRTGPASGILQDVDPAAYVEAAGVLFEQVRLAAADFANGGRSLAVGPGVSASSASATTLAIAVVALNEAAGNVGRTVWPGPVERERTTYAGLAALVEEMAAGQVPLLMVQGPNPLYELPDTDRVEAGLAAVPAIVSFSPWLDETSARAHLLLPDHHFLEAWGDHEPVAGVHSLIQPVMTPVFQTKHTGDVLLSVARRANATLPTPATTFYDYLRDEWRQLQGRVGGGGTFDEWWVAALQDGVVVTDAYQQPEAPAAAAPMDALPVEARPLDGDGDLHLVVYPSYRFYDGRLANRPWLQELPDPVSKHTWGTVVEIHPRTADALGLDNGHIVAVSTPAGSMEAPVWRHPGIREDTIAIQLGQGHEGMGRYAKNRGANAIKLLASSFDPRSGGLVWIQAMATVSPTGRWERQPFSSEQTTEQGRNLLRFTTVAAAVEADRTPVPPRTAGVPIPDPDPTEREPGGLHMGPPAEDEDGYGVPVHPNEVVVQQLQESGGFGAVAVPAGPADYPPIGTHYGEYTDQERRWSMVIDLERCIGCSACMTACQAENNIGMVGPDLVAQGRLIQWMRIERYFDLDNDGEPRSTTFLPMLCQHCGNAPCEPVCPVYASYHTPDGLNAQVYNRCVGTRYCSNNCPYKVRYFNYFSYDWPEPLNWQLNPDVSVREKGIMEKCTFCVQRIRDAEHQARLAGSPLRDGAIVPACAQTCPGNAIVFGDIKDPSSRVAHVSSSGRSFRVFEDLNVAPGVIYLKKVVDGASIGSGA
jgi:anaerobic selenocysteine-containing dehydrogenase/Fe-S-cluster-containing dehydrogenase component